ncbi:MAG: DUF2927 domain-containing protein [Paracoccaceae bacterium]
MRALAALVLTGLIAGCVPTSDVQRLDSGPGATEPVRVYRPGVPQPFAAARSNGQMVQDFLELGFAMESGRPIESFSRFDGPVRVVTRGTPPGQALFDLERLLGRLRSEAQIDIARVAQAPEGANTITVEFLPRATMQAVVPAAACFVVPNVSSWGGFVANRRSPSIDWTRVVTRTSAAVFIPDDTTPQEIRDCLHEEIGQALGPLNDLFRLTDSVFNDDNFQTTLTGFDMLLLRVWNSAELTPGLTRDQVAARLPALFNRLNPHGRRPLEGMPGLTPRNWVQSVEQALASSGGHQHRREGANRALGIARANGWQDTRLALSLMLAARLAPREQGEDALQGLLRAGDIYRATPGGEVHAAHIDMQLAVQALANAQVDTVLALTARASPVAARTENAALLASLGFLRAEALAMAGRADEARAVRLDSFAAARYGFGSDSAAHTRMDEIARIAASTQLARR